MHLKSLLDWTPSAISKIIQRSALIKKDLKNGLTMPQALTGKTLALLFTKKSTRTRLSAETGWAHYGGHSVFLSPQDCQLSGGETWSDTARVVGSMASCVLARVHAHQDLEELCQYSSAPVLNALSDKFHPLQILADALTIKELFQDKPVKIAWVKTMSIILTGWRF